MVTALGSSQWRLVEFLFGRAIQTNPANIPVSNTHLYFVVIFNIYSNTDIIRTFYSYNTDIISIYIYNIIIFSII